MLTERNNGLLEKMPVKELEKVMFYATNNLSRIRGLAHQDEIAAEDLLFYQDRYEILVDMADKVVEVLGFKEFCGETTNEYY